MEYRNAIWNGLGGIDCEINHPKLGWVPFTASPTDVEETGRDVFEQIKDFAAEYIPPTIEQSLESFILEVRLERNRRLQEEVDPMVMNSLRWGDLTDGQRQAWADYRRALLDVTDQEGFPDNVVWPTRP